VEVARVTWHAVSLVVAVVVAQPSPQQVELWILPDHQAPANRIFEDLVSCPAAGQHGSTKMRMLMERLALRKIATSRLSLAFGPSPSAGSDLAALSVAPSPSGGSDLAALSLRKPGIPQEQLGRAPQQYASQELLDDASLATKLPCYLSRTS
jgi:hypothetical protein